MQNIVWKKDEHPTAVLLDISGAYDMVTNFVWSERRTPNRSFAGCQWRL
jgi:hypothetical protein